MIDDQGLAHELNLPKEQAMNIEETSRKIAQQRAASGVLESITAEQVSAYCVAASKEQAERIAASYNETWAGRSWEIRDGELVYQD